MAECLGTNGCYAPEVMGATRRCDGDDGEHILFCALVCIGYSEPAAFHLEKEGGHDLPGVQRAQFLQKKRGSAFSIKADDLNERRRRGS